jgi:hypothetical protein
MLQVEPNDVLGRQLRHFLTAHDVAFVVGPATCRMQHGKVDNDS